MTWVLYAGYEDKEDAEQAFGALLEMGLASEDLSLVLAADRSDREVRRAAMRSVDSGQAHPEELRMGPGRFQEEGLEGIESSIGGGIATDTYDDDASGVEEMDEGQEAAERVAEPLQERWYGMEDLADAMRFAALGTIDSTRPATPGFGTKRKEPAGTRRERPYSVTVLGGVAVLGDGVLATETLAGLLQDPKTVGADALKAGLRHAGVSAAEGRELAAMFDSGGAVLAVTEAPGRVSIQDVESHVESSGGRWMRTFLVQSA